MEEVDDIDHDISLKSFGVLMLELNDHEIGWNLDHELSGLQRRAAFPASQLARIARGRHRSGTEISRDEDGVAIDPVDTLLRFRQRESVFEKRFAFKIDFADDRRIATFGR